MGQSPSRLSEVHQTLVLDASVAINILGSGRPELLLRALGRQMLLVHVARDEIRHDPATGKPGRVVIDQLESQGLLTSVDLDEAGYATFLDLTGAPAPYDIDDGEAGTIACAEQIAAVALLDDKKATATALARPSGIKVLNTLDLYSSPVVTDQISNQDLGDLVFNSLRNARMRVTVDFRPWVISLIGQERANQCSSMGGLRMQKPCSH